MSTVKRSKPYLTNEDRITMKIRNPMDGKFVSKSFKYGDYQGKAGAIEASKTWAEDVQKLIDEKNALNPIQPKSRKPREPEKKLIQDIEERKLLHAMSSTPHASSSVSVVPLAMSSTPPVAPSTIAPSTIAPSTRAPSTIAPSTRTEDIAIHLDKKAFPYKTWIPEKTGSSLVLMAKSKAGKTSLLHHIVKNLPKDMIKIVISPNIHNSIYDSMKNRCVFSPIFDSRIVKLCQKINQKTKNHYRFVIILDDVIDEKANSSVLKMFLTLRNSAISAILSVQSVFLINKMIRGNANYVLLGKLSGEEAIVDTYKKFLVNYKDEIGIKHESDIVPVYDELTRDFNFIFMNNLKEKIFITNKDL